MLQPLKGEDILMSQKLVSLALGKRCPEVEESKSEGVCKSRLPALHAESTEAQGHRDNGSLFTGTRKNCTKFTVAQQLIELTKTKSKIKQLPHRSRRN